MTNFPQRLLLISLLGLLALIESVVANADHGSGALITVYGTNACATYGNWAEDWSYGVIQPT